MPTDKDVKRTELKIGAGGLLAGIGAYLTSNIPLADPQWHDAVLHWVTTPLGVGSGVAIGGPIAFHRWYFTPTKVFKRQLGKDGWLNAGDLRESAGEAALRRQAAQLRPLLPTRTPEGKAQPINEYGTRLGKLVSGTANVRGKSIYSKHSQGLLVIGPPGSGKSMFLLNQVLDFPGAVYASTTKTELFDLAGELRAQRGPVHVFNPSGYGGVASTLRFNPVDGCQDPEVAHKRAWSLIRGAGGMQGVENADFWSQKAQEIVRGYLMAAAFAGFHMGAVHYWATNSGDPRPVEILQSQGNRVPPEVVNTLIKNLEAAPNTQSGYFASVVSAVGFMDNPIVAEACRSTTSFDIDAFLWSGTIFVVAGEDRRLAPLLTVMTEYIFDTAKQYAARSPGRKLPNGLAMILDEVAQTTPVELDKWAADSRGWNITVTAAVQALTQLDTTWGESRADTIYESLPTKIALRGITNTKHLDALAYLAGKRVVEQYSQGESRQGSGQRLRRSTSKTRHISKEPVIEGHTIGQLPMWYAYVVGVASRAAVVRFEPGFKRAKRELRKLKHGKKNPPPPGARYGEGPQLSTPPNAGQFQVVRSANLAPVVIDERGAGGPYDSARSGVPGPSGGDPGGYPPNGPGPGFHGGHDGGPQAGGGGQ